eukprot:CAMPEP_0196578866 /NCGR_PEP_ID=MMETSP1081-20130531/11590_1 /TAXON_ID=36882 /ORGANISM="Pyramimonas amylifera, Strain CCMP720" /LENGTH=103 /DNA_ID=CAMNT_0041898243 /DNA_START=108 /DNA_END=416 /DNA_ORIENTATION=+
MQLNMRLIGAIIGFALATLSITHAADFFYNDVSGATQWEEPDLPVAYQDEEGRKYWHDGKSGEATWEYPGSWNEVQSEEHGQPYFFNKETQASQWERPEPMGW